MYEANNFQPFFSPAGNQTERHAALRFYLKTGKNPFEKEDENDLSSEVSRVENEKKHLGASSPWSALIAVAGRCSSSPKVTQNNVVSDDVMGNHVLDVSLKKAVSSLRFSTGLTEQDVRQELFLRLNNNKLARKNITNAVRFFRDANVSWFTECENCGTENTPPWNTCRHCSIKRE